MPAGQLLGARLVGGAAGVVLFAGPDLGESPTRAADGVRSLAGGGHPYVIARSSDSFFRCDLADVGDAGVSSIGGHVVAKAAALRFLFGRNVGEVDRCADRPEVSLLSVALSVAPF